MMDMLLRNLGYDELGAILERHKDRTSIPHLVDPGAVERARSTAKRNGVWKRISQELDPTREIPARKRSLFRNFARNGNRMRHLRFERARTAQLELAALALWLNHPKGDLDYLQDLLWTYCDDWTWVMPAHESAAVDLGSAAHAARFAEILSALKHLIEPEVADRVRAEIEKRVLRPVWDYDNTEFWHTTRMNWNHVCNGGFVRAALLEIGDPKKLARSIHPVIQNMTYALDGFTDDGGCEEGPGYWGYGFGHFVWAAHALHCRTGGELDIMAHEKVERICRYPLAAHIEGSQRTTFADSGPGSIAPLVALQINHFYPIPELYELCPRQKDGGMSGAGKLKIDDMHSLGLYRGEKATGKADPKDYVLPDLGVVKLRGGPGPDRMTLAALAGNNGVPHNHNDIGSFMLYARGRMFLTDPGGPLYNKQTFSKRRYEIIHCRSRGHSVPIINGEEQTSGKQFRGELSVEGLNEEGAVKAAVIDMGAAYPEGSVASLIRRLELDTVANTLAIEDACRFDSKPKSLEEAFVTFEKAEVVSGGDAVRIGPVRDGATLTVEQPGTFAVEIINEKPEHLPPGQPPIQRVTFTPETLKKEMTLRFTLRLNSGGGSRERKKEKKKR